MLSQHEIKYINALKIKKYRTKYSEFIAEGDKIIKELIDKGIEVVNIYTINNETFNDKKAQIVSEEALNKVTALQHHYNSLAVFKIPDNKFDVKKDEWIVLLDDIQDPGPRCLGGICGCYPAKQGFCMLENVLWIQCLFFTIRTGLQKGGLFFSIILNKDTEVQRQP